MKKVIIYTLLTIGVLASCNSKKEENKNNNKTEPKMKTIHLTKEMFLEKVMNFEKNPTEWKYLGDKPCIIDFYAQWCGPCKAVAPILEQIAEEYDGKIYVYKIDTEEQQELAAAFGIQSIPTIYFCPMNESPQMAMGALPKATIKQAIADVLHVK
jgi:thioredoxin